MPPRGELPPTTNSKLFSIITESQVWPGSTHHVWEQVHAGCCPPGGHLRALYTVYYPYNQAIISGGMGEGSGNKPLGRGLVQLEHTNLQCCPDWDGIQSICQVVPGTRAPLQNVPSNLGLQLQGLWTGGIITLYLVDMPQGSSLLAEGSFIHSYFRSQWSMLLKMPVSPYWIKHVENNPRHTQTLIYYIFLVAKIAIASAGKALL